MIYMRTVMKRQFVNISGRCSSSNINLHKKSSENTPYLEVRDHFETVYKLPFITKISLFNRLKIYQAFGTVVAVPSCFIMESLNIISNQSTLTAAYVGLTGVILLSLASLPLRNIIGFLYISNDENQIKISFVDFLGKRQDKIISTEEWIPLFDMPSRKMDILYLKPKLVDGTSYKLFIKFGEVMNANKMGRVLE